MFPNSIIASHPCELLLFCLQNNIFALNGFGLLCFFLSDVCASLNDSRAFQLWFSSECLSESLERKQTSVFLWSFFFSVTEVCPLRQPFTWLYLQPTKYHLFWSHKQHTVWRFLRILIFISGRGRKGESLSSGLSLSQCTVHLSGHNSLS